MPIKRHLEAQVGVWAEEDGRLALRSYSATISEMLQQDAGKRGMPPLSAYLSGQEALIDVLSLDATGHGKLQINTIAILNPYLSASAQHLRTIGVGNVADDRDGSRRLLGGNLDVINSTIRSKVTVVSSITWAMQALFKTVTRCHTPVT